MSTKAKGRGNAELLTLMLKGEDGEAHAREVAIDRAVLATIQTGMRDAAKLQNFWIDNADRIIFEFYGEDPFAGSSKAEMLSQFRASEELAVMYAVFQEKHPDAARAARLALQAANHPDTDAGKDAKDALGTLRTKIRKLANAQAIKVCAYYCDAHAADKAAEERETPDAWDLIDATIKDWANRCTLARGKLADESQRNILNGATQTLRDYVTATRKAQAEAQPTSTLTLKRPTDSHPVGRAAQAAAQKAGVVKTLTPGQYKEAQASEVFAAHVTA